MDLIKMLTDLHSERAAIIQAIDVLERFAKTRGKRRGRPPVWLALARGLTPSPVERKTPVRGPETRKRMAEAQKKRWAAYRKAKETSAQ
jgi:hypothetical protein